ncbi:hypothetical protein Tco_0584293 [Tanacetum coccineum]
MVDMVNQRKKHFAKERAKAKRNKPMTQSQLRIYMSNYLKNQGTWKLSQLKKLSFEEIKEEFDKLVQRIDTFVPMDFEATKAKKKASKRTGKRKKQKARKGISVDKNAQGDSETDKEESVEAMNPTPLATKSNIVYGTNRPEDAYDRVLWSDLRTINCLTIEASTIYMLADRKYPLSKDACQVMLKMKLLDGTMDEVCYKLLKMIEKQVRCLSMDVFACFMVPIEPEVGAAAVASPVEVLELDTHSSSEADQSESSLPPVSVAPMVSHFPCLDDSESDTEILERHVSPTPHDVMLTRWRSIVASRSSSPTTSTPEIPTAPILPAPSAIVAPSSGFPLAPVVAPPGIRR